MPNGTVQTDAQGRRYVQTARGPVYISPVAFGEKAPSDPGMWRNKRFNQRTGQWETPIDWGTVGSLAVGSVIAAPYVAGAIGSMGGGSAAAGTGTGAGAAATTGGGSVAAKGFFPTLGRWLGTATGAQLLNTGGQLAAGYLQNRASNRAAQLQQQANADALAYLKEQDARDFAEYQKERERGWRYEDEDRGRKEEDRQLLLLREREREGRLAPFRDGAATGYKTLSSLLMPLPNGRIGMPMPVSPAARPVRLADLVGG